MDTPPISGVQKVFTPDTEGSNLEKLSGMQKKKNMQNEAGVIESNVQSLRGNGPNGLIGLLAVVVKSPLNSQISWVADSLEGALLINEVSIRSGLHHNVGPAQDTLTKGETPTSLQSQVNGLEHSINLPASPAYSPLERGQSSRRRKVKRLFSRSAHLIETHQMTDGLCVKVLKDDLELATTIKRDRQSRGRRLSSVVEEVILTTYCNSSWLLKVASPSASTAATHPIQVCSPTSTYSSSSSSLSLTHRIGNEIGVTFHITVVGIHQIGGSSEVK